MFPFQKSKRLLSALRRTVEMYGMLAPGDKVAVGLSGGKDSIALLSALAIYRRFSTVPFTLLAITVDMGEGPGIPRVDFSSLAEFCAALDVPHRLVPSDIARKVFGNLDPSPPVSRCAVCARLRRGILLHEAAVCGCTKLALGHHARDAAVTFLMNLLNEGRLGCFSPVMAMTAVTVEKDGEALPLSVIRPLLLAQAGDIRYFVHTNGLPVIPSHCPVDGHTDRARMDALLRALARERPGIVHRILHAMEKAGLDGWKVPPSKEMQTKAKEREFPHGKSKL